eukprot:TRINITY_DN7129_c0_g1_i5.p1 TRINITY_DN7129_c0_g1~~TRINITY_DN7129_c0_g1_i5.p1  ORF type:complete len:219 (-),score=33.28 TRINITY_DN7129_c0_g1_i5:92-748(-)
MKCSFSFLALVVALCYFSAPVFATYGLDLSQATSQASFDCLHQNGYDFAVVRCYQSVGRVDPNCGDSVNRAWASGMAHVDVYLFPCFSCGNPAGQVSATISYLRNNNVKFGMLWFDIEGPGTYWGSSQSANANFFAGLVSEARALGVTIGIYTSASQWNPIMGGYTGGSPYPLWYAHYDGSASFSDFSAFGGWTKPSIKQFAGTTAICSAGIDKNWYP